MVNIKILSIEDRIKHLFEQNLESSRVFCSPDAWSARMEYRLLHKTEIYESECIDGRIDIPLITQTPPGIMRQFRNVGGIFRMGWPYLSSEINQGYEYARKHNRHLLFLVTYHYSGSSPSFGCAGCDHNTELALKTALNFRNELEEVFGYNHDVVCPVLIGIDTDTDAMTIHGDNPDNKIVMSDHNFNGKKNKTILGLLIRGMLKKMPGRVFNDLIHLLANNIRHIREVEKSIRPMAEIKHGEWWIGVGRGFDWHHEHNQAVLVGPYDPNLANPINTAVKVIRSNIENDRIPKDGFLVLASAVYKGEGIDAIGKERAIKKARYFAELASEIINDQPGELASLMRIITVVNNYDTRLMEVV
jgi:hypothetical protein